MVPVAALTFSLVSKLCARLDMVEEAVKGCRGSAHGDAQDALILQPPGRTCSCTCTCGAAAAGHVCCGGQPGSGATVSAATAVELLDHAATAVRSRRVAAEGSAACMAALGDKIAEWQKQLLRFDFQAKDIASRVTRLELRMQELLDGLMPTRGNSSLDSFSAGTSSGDTATQRHGVSGEVDMAAWAWPHPAVGGAFESLGGQVYRLREAVAEAQAESQCAPRAEMGDDVQKMREHALSLERQMQVLQRHMDVLRMHSAPGGTSHGSSTDTAVVVALADGLTNTSTNAGPPAGNSVSRESSAAAASLGPGRGVGRRPSIPCLSGLSRSPSSPGSPRQSICSLASNCTAECGGSGTVASGGGGSGCPSPGKASSRSTFGTSRGTTGGASNRSALGTSRGTAGEVRGASRPVRRALSPSLVS